MVKAKAKPEPQQPTRRSSRVAELEKAKPNARGKRKQVGGDARAPKRTKLAALNPLPVPGLAHYNLPFTFPLPPPTKNKPLLYVFGSNGSNELALQLDDDDDDEIREPTLVDALVNLDDPLFGSIEDVAASRGMHTLAVSSSGKVWSWGSNDALALGRITLENDDKAAAKKKEGLPGLVQGLPPTYRATRVHGSDIASVSISAKGRLFIWGQLRDAQGPIPFDGISGHPDIQATPITPPGLETVKFSSVAAGSNHFIGLDVDGEVWTWGANEAHVLGRELRGRQALSAGLTPRKLHLRHITAVSAGMYTSFAINQEGHVFAWGSNAFTQTGIRDQEFIEHPTLVEALLPENLGGAKVVQIGGGEFHALFLLDNGSVYSCGGADDYQVGLPKAHPAMEAAVRARTEAKARLNQVYADELKRLQDRVAAGEELKEDPVSTATQVANEQVNIPRVAITVPTRITFPADEDGQEPKIVQVAVGTRHNLAVSAGGHAYSFGTGDGGQLGQGDPEIVSKPRRINGDVKDLRVIKATAGGTSGMLLAVSREEPTEPKPKRTRAPGEAIDTVLIVRSPTSKTEAAALPDAEAQQAADMDVDEKQADVINGTE